MNLLIKNNYGVRGSNADDTIYGTLFSDTLRLFAAGWLKWRFWEVSKKGSKWGGPGEGYGLQSGGVPKRVKKGVKKGG